MDKKEKLKEKRKENARKWRAKIKQSGFMLVQIITKPHLKDKIKKYCEQLNKDNGDA